MTTHEIFARIAASSIQEMTLVRKIQDLTKELEKSREEKDYFYSMYENSLKTTSPDSFTSSKTS